MRVYRVHVDDALCPGRELDLGERAAHHLVRVLRHRSGDRVVLFDGHGTEADAEIVSAHRRHGCRVRVLGAAAVSRESPLAIELLPGMARGEKIDWVIQKAVELGASAIRPIITQRSQVRPDRDQSRRLERWREIAIGACEQSGRTWLPTIDAPVELHDVEVSAATRLVLDPAGAHEPAACRPENTVIALAVGPEGGLSDTDLSVLGDKGFERMRFGPRVLRTETAAIAAIAALQALFGDLGTIPAHARRS